MDSSSESITQLQFIVVALTPVTAIDSAPFVVSAVTVAAQVDRVASAAINVGVTAVTRAVLAAFAVLRMQPTNSAE